MWNGDEEFNRKCGEVLQIELNIENDLEQFISAYCGFRGSYWKTVFGQRSVFQTKTSIESIHCINRLLVQRLNLQVKIDIFEEICKVEKISKEEYLPILGKIRETQTIRNKVAHGERYSDFSQKFKIKNKRRKFLGMEQEFQDLFREDKSSLELNGELLKKLKQDQIIISAYMYSLVNKLLVRRKSKRKKS